MYRVQEAGHTVKADILGSDVVVINTCGFIDSAKSEAIDYILQTAALKNEGLVGKILVTGCLSQRYQQVILEELPEVDGLLVEGTTLSRGLDFHEPSEQELEDFAVETLEGHKGPTIVYLSAQNVDRIVTAYNAAQRAGRRFIMDELTALVAEAAGLQLDGFVLRASHSLADLGEVVAATAGGSGASDHISLTGHRRIAKAFPAISARKAFASPDFMLCLTPQSLINFQKVIQRTSFRDGVLFIARRENAILKPATSAFISFMKSIGAEVPVLHTSGHADSGTIDRLIRDVRPSVLIPVHTELAEWFARYEDECLVVYDCRDYEI